MKGLLRHRLGRLLYRTGKRPLADDGPGLLLERIARPGQHEREITALLGADNVIYRGAEPEFDYPLVLLGFSNRSGSTLLGEYLRQSGKVHGLGEFCNHDFVGNQIRKAGLETFPDLIRQLEKGRGARPLFGLKVSWDQLAMLLRWNIPAMFAGVRLLHISRLDLLGRAVSMSIARQTGKWASTQEGSGVEPVLNMEEIDALIQHQQLGDALLRLTAGAFDLPFHWLAYEGLLHNPTQHIRSALHFIGTPCPGWEPQPPRLQKQAGPVNEAFRASYLQEVRGRLLSGRAPERDPDSTG